MKGRFFHLARAAGARVKVRWTPPRLRRALANAATAFEPADLGARLLALYDISDNTSLKQNIDGTGAVADGDRVGYVADLSGNGQHMVAAANNTTRPIYRANAGRPYLEFDEADDVLSTATPGLTADTDVIAGIVRQAAQQMLVHVGGFNTPYAGIANDGFGAAQSGAGAPSYRIDGAETGTTSGDALHDLLFQLQPSVFTVASADLSGAANLALGAWGGGWGSAKRLYAYAAADALTADERSALEQWVGGKVWSDASFSNGKLSTTGLWFAEEVKGRDVRCTLRAGSTLRTRMEMYSATLSIEYFVPPEETGGLFALYLDGAATGDTVSLAGTAGVLTSTAIATDLTIGETYDIELRLQGVSQDWDGNTIQIVGLTGGTARAWPDTRPKRLVVGDSITAGNHARGSGNSHAECAGDITFGRVWCDETGHQLVNNGFGGTGITTAGVGDVPAYGDGSGTNPAFYHRSGVPIDHDDYDEIAIVIGTNDGAAVDATFKAGYKALVQAYQAAVPGATIRCVRPFLGTKATQIAAAASEVGASYLDTSGFTGLTTTDGVHLDLAGHEAAGEQLAAL